ncbi:CDG_1a_G0041400.mRNA.1.CDS.1 [Saccharomyces cerevisiae]|nr:BJ4_G0021700.mRNA.1.CDS.1 [Saccharomyces cerevisiae]CAI4688404.1 CDG_1a_G0041400.mRNA.1.CDS.1 [Saccharomyces cerevisiae]CAI4698544.1 CQI_4a_G0040940.mRNA.1.CDS.1 [Saccharomyces cerevisiae]CAI6844920.1 ADM_collapsed_G0042550.mRNA.1.CDS.1 [Saccharomyces cerevisiae]CAI7425467.1 CQI_4a_G0040940.mRNA.1.CDS.1 [Saccharomyces cerevisiae]
MCGIFGYCNFLIEKTRGEIIDTLIEGLQALEYKEYDSSGISIQGDELKSLNIYKQTGKISSLKEEIDLYNLNKNLPFISHCGIAHTRRATHGGLRRANCHPHNSDPSNEFVVVHNGVITNFANLKALLVAKGYVFKSDTDTECIPKLYKHIYDTSIELGYNLDFHVLTNLVLKELEGSYGLLCTSSHFPDEVVAARKGSPLVIGVKGKTDMDVNFVEVEYLDQEEDYLKLNTQTKSSGNVLAAAPVKYNTCLRKSPPLRSQYLRNSTTSTFNHGSSTETPAENGLPRPMEFYLSSDCASLARYVSKVVYLEDNDIAHIYDGELHIHCSKIGSEDFSFRTVQKLELELSKIKKGPYDNFMQKEIYEQCETTKNVMRGRVDAFTNRVVLGGLENWLTELRRAKRIIMIASKASFHSCLAARPIFEELMEVPVNVELALDFVDRNCCIFRNDVCIFVSRSGETTDTINALNYCIKKEAVTIGVVNCSGSSISRFTHCGVHTNTGPEKGIATTKSYTSQYIALVMIALWMSEDLVSKIERRKEIIQALTIVPSQIKEVLELEPLIIELCDKKLKQHDTFLLLGRGYQFASALEGASKMKEISYVHSESILTDELGHRVLAVASDNPPIIAFATKDAFSPKIASCIDQIIERKGNPIIICNKGHKIWEQDKQKGNVVTLEVPQTVDCLQGILNVIPLQLISYWLAIKKDIGVDLPRDSAMSAPDI